MENNILSPWKRFLGLLKLERKDIFQIAYYAIFEGIVALSLPLGIQAIVITRVIIIRKVPACLIGRILKDTFRVH